MTMDKCHVSQGRNRSRTLPIIGLCQHYSARHAIWLVAISVLPLLSVGGLSSHADSNISSAGAAGRSVDARVSLAVLGEVHLPANLADATATVQPVKDGLTYCEGPVFDRQGCLYFSECNKGIIWKVTPAGVATPWRIGVNVPNGLELNLKGNIVCCETDKVTELDATGRVIRNLAVRPSFSGSPNDLSIGPSDGMFFTNNGSAFYFRAPNGTITTYASAIPPNGIEWIEEQDLLYVNLCATSPPESGTLSVFNVQKDGVVNLGSRRDLATVRYPDGLTTDANGNVYVAEYGRNRVVVLDPSGTMLGYILMTQNGATEGNASNCVFGGPGRTTLYITGTGGAYKVQLKVPGRIPPGNAIAEPRFGGKQVASGVYVLDSPSNYGAANMGWIDEGDHVVLIGAPHVDLVNKALSQIQSSLGKPVQMAILTQSRSSEASAIQLLINAGIQIIYTGQTLPSQGARPIPIDLMQMGQVAGSLETMVWLPTRKVLFAGEICVNGPRVPIPGTSIPLWLKALDRIRLMEPEVVVPGFGSTGGIAAVTRQRNFLAAIKYQVAYVLVEGRDANAATQEFHLPHDLEGWFPYDAPTSADIQAAYAQFSVPQAPYLIDPFDPTDTRPRALVLISDRPHAPEILEAGLLPAFEAAGINPRFAFDPRALSAANLAQVQLLVILRDGTYYSSAGSGTYTMWMTTAQQQAVSDFVTNGNGFLALHNAPGLYPAGGAYLHTLGGVYNSHGPMERFAVRVTDPAHPVTLGVNEFQVPDEQHTPIPDPGVHQILQSISESGVVATAGWVREQGTGRACYLTNGHTREALANPTYQRLLRNAMLWCLKRSTISTEAKDWPRYK